jgi:hypothetical protein
VSFEHEIENRKNEYYQVLRSCQAQRPNEDVTVWMQFFLSCLSNIQLQLITKLHKSGFETQLSPKEKSIFTDNSKPSEHSVWEKFPKNWRYLHQP